MSATVMHGVSDVVSDVVVNVVTGLFAGVVGDSNRCFFGSGSEQESSSESVQQHYQVSTIYIIKSLPIHLLTILQGPLVVVAWIGF